MVHCYFLPKPEFHRSPNTSATVLKQIQILLSRTLTLSLGFGHCLCTLFLKMLILIKEYACGVDVQEITGVGRVAELHRIDMFAYINGISGYFYSGVEDSWTKQLVVGPLKGIQKPLGFVKNEELILLRDDEDQTIALYNIGSEEIKNFQHSGLPNSFRSRHAQLYLESLVSLNGGKA